MPEVKQEVAAAQTEELTAGQKASIVFDQYADDLKLSVQTETSDEEEDSHCVVMANPSTQLFIKEYGFKRVRYAIQ